MEKKNKLQIVFYILIALVLITGVTYAFFRVDLLGDKEYSITTAGLVFRYTEMSQGITLEDPESTSDTNGINSESYFDFSIYAEDKAVKYLIYLEGNINNDLNPDYVKVYLTDQSNSEIVSPIKVSNLDNYNGTSNSYILYNTTITPDATSHNATQYYRLRMWLSEDFEAAGGIEYSTSGKTQTGEVQATTFSFKVNIASDNNLDNSGANIPKLVTNMVPVYYDSANDTWKIADKSNSNTSYQWYDYDAKQWANMVMVKETASTCTIGTDCIDSTTKHDRSYYTNQANVGQSVSMDDILAMYVWIPRFSATGDTANYNGVTQSNPGAFTITFVNSSTTAHDAFTFGEQNLSGIWVGKFETSHTTLVSSTTENNLGCTTETCSNANDIIIKPNVRSLRYNNVSNFFYATRSMSQTSNSFGFDTTTDTTLNTHMMKNNEWGAVAYLTQSNYGRCTSGVCTEVYINNSSYYTGRSGGNTGGLTPISGTYTDQTSTATFNIYGFYTYDGYLLTYNTNTKSTTKDMSKVASTTGNIYGIYDMSGGASEYVMGVYWDGTQYWSGESSTHNSGFNGCLGSSCSSTKTDGIEFFGPSNAKYYNLYTTSTAYTTANLQHAMIETTNWYSDYAHLINVLAPWVKRSDYYYSGSYAGVFLFGNLYGDSNGLDIGVRSSIIK